MLTEALVLFLYKYEEINEHDGHDDSFRHHTADETDHRTEADFNPLIQILFIYEQFS